MNINNPFLHSSNVGMSIQHLVHDTLTTDNNKETPFHDHHSEALRSDDGSSFKHETTH